MMTTKTAPTPTTVAALAALVAKLSPEDRKALRETVTKTATAPKPCGCGCGATTQRRFAVGHDARLKGRLIAAFRADAKLDPPTSLVPNNTDPVSVAAALGWSSFLVPAKAKEPKAPKAEKAPKPAVKQAKATPTRPSAKEQAEAAVADADAKAARRAELKAK